VDFEFPDEEGKPYKSNGGEMVESEMGEVPKGWRVGKLGEILELQRGFDLPSQNRKFGKYPIYASTGIAQLHNEYKVKAPCVVTGRSGSLGEVFYVNEDFWPLNTTLWVKDFKASKPLFVFFLLKSINLLDYNDGSAVPTLNRNAVHLHQIMIPDMETIEKFDNLQKNLFSSIKICVTELSLLERMKVLLLAKMVKEII
jgi:type I restriction enzyme S subunit